MVKYHIFRSWNDFQCIGLNNLTHNALSTSNDSHLKRTKKYTIFKRYLYAIFSSWATTDKHSVPLSITTLESINTYLVRLLIYPLQGILGRRQTLIFQSHFFIMFLVKIIKWSLFSVDESPPIFGNLHIFAIIIK